MGGLNGYGTWARPLFGARCHNHALGLQVGPDAWLWQPTVSSGQVVTATPNGAVAYGAQVTAVVPERPRPRARARARPGTARLAAPDDAGDGKIVIDDVPARRPGRGTPADQHGLTALLLRAPNVIRSFVFAALLRGLFSPKMISRLRLVSSLRVWCHAAAQRTTGGRGTAAWPGERADGHAGQGHQRRILRQL
jgi:hypothetical protein